MKKTWIFRSAAFLSAFLLFQIQPMMSKALLPAFGGSYLVWGACMVFFQAALLAGYVYAHAVSLWISPAKYSRLHSPPPSSPVLRTGRNGGATTPEPWRRRVGIWLRRSSAGNPRALYGKLHWLVLLAPLLFLKEGMRIPVESTQNTWLALSVMRILIVRVGLPVFVLSTAGLLLQRWLSLSELSERDNPYFLYAASNLGSILGLLTYPILIEPMLSLQTQWWVWWGGYFAAACVQMLCLPARSDSESDGHRTTVGTPLRGVRGRLGEPSLPYEAPFLNQADKRSGEFAVWFALGVAGCAVLLAVTNVITLDVASVPFLWVLPLSVYLLSFVLTFKQKMWYPPWIRKLAYWMLMLGSLLYLMSQLRLAVAAPIAIMLHLVILFVICLACNGELILSKPDDPRRLTVFYLAIAAGGLAGSLLVGWMIPLVSRSLIEYPLSFVLAVVAIAFAARLRRTPEGVAEQSSGWNTSCSAGCPHPAKLGSPDGDIRRYTGDISISLLPDDTISAVSSGDKNCGDACPHASKPPDGDIRRYTFSKPTNQSDSSGRAGSIPSTICAVVVMVLALTIVPHLAHSYLKESGASATVTMMLMAAPVALALLGVAYQPWRFAVVLLAFSVAVTWSEDLATGATSVKKLRNYYGIYKVFDKDNLRYLKHGTTLHGRQYITGPDVETPLAYFHPTTPAAGVLTATNLCFRRIGMIGLGSGALAAYAGNGQTFTIMELDPDNIPIARNNFTYLDMAERNGARVDYRVGDGRMSLRGMRDSSLDLIMVDAFNSGSIPVHLITVEAFDDYFRVLGKEGLLLMHVSNKMLDLTPVVYSNARSLGLAVCEKNNSGNVHPDAELTFWVALSKDAALINKLVTGQGWWQRKEDAKSLPRPWTDQYCNLLGAMMNR